MSVTQYLCSSRDADWMRTWNLSWCRILNMNKRNQCHIQFFNTLSKCLFRSQFSVVMILKGLLKSKRYSNYKMLLWLWHKIYLVNEFGHNWVYCLAFTACVRTIKVIQNYGIIKCLWFTQCIYEIKHVYLLLFYRLQKLMVLYQCWSCEVAVKFYLFLFLNVNKQSASEYVESKPIPLCNSNIWGSRCNLQIDLLRWNAYGE